MKYQILDIEDLLMALAKEGFISCQQYTNKGDIGFKIIFDKYVGTVLPILPNRINFYTEDGSPLEVYIDQAICGAGVDVSCCDGEE